MRLHRFIGEYEFDMQPTGITAFDNVLRTIEISEPRMVTQIRSVLKLKVGEEIILCDGKGTDARARITAIKARAVEAEVQEISKNETESSIACILWVSVLKKDSFEWVVQKATEVGVTHVFPLITKRTVKTALSFSRLFTIAREAAEQSGRGRVPTIFEPLAFEQAIHDAKQQGPIVFCDPSGSEQISHLRLGKEKIINIFIGPEGGWDPYEIDRARISGASIVSLGRTTLRAETAAVVASYVVVSF